MPRRLLLVAVAALAACAPSRAPRGGSHGVAPLADMMPSGGDGAAAGAANDGGNDTSGGDGGGAAGGGSDGGGTIDVALWHARADRALEALLLDYWNPSQAYLNAAAPANGSLTGYWTFAQALDAVLDGAVRSGGKHWLGTVETLYEAQAKSGWSRDFYDDENWMALALLRAYDLTGDGKFLDEAKALYGDIEAAWDTTCCASAPGGIWWDRPHTQKATASNAGPVITGIRLAARTGDASYRTFATRVFQYWLANMTDKNTFAVFDHISPNGQITKYRFTYNEGLMIGAAVELFKDSKDPQYLTTAESIAGYMLATETKSGVLFDGTNAQCNGDCQQFKGIGYRYLMSLYEVDKQQQYLGLLQASAQSIWDHARAANDLFAADWLGPPRASTSIDAQSSAAMALDVYAASLGADPEPAAPGTWEAEDGVLHAVGLEATHAGHSGWGYVAGWNGDGQWVDFHVTTARAGAHVLTLRYAAGAGNASRLIYVNGADAIANQTFTATGSWDQYATTTATVTLPAGASTISVIYNSSKGSTSYLNLDRITLDP